MADLLKLKGQDFVLTKGVLKVYILQKYIDSGDSAEKKSSVISKIEGNVVISLGLLPFRWYASIKDAEAEKPSIVGTLDIPSSVHFYPEDIDTGKDILIYPESYIKPYTILTFYESHKCFQANIVKSLSNVTLFFEDLFLTGRLDDNIPYNMLATSCLRNMEMNNVSLHVPITPICIIVNRMCRSAKDMSKTFAESIAHMKNPPMIGYRFMNVREMSASSVFGGLSFEDFNYMVDLGISMTAEDKKQHLSPLEDLVKL